MKSSQPVSRVLSLSLRIGVCHLSTPVVTNRLQRSTLRRGASNPHNVGLHDLTTPKMHSPHVTMRLVGSYPTFSPLPGNLIRFRGISLRKLGGYFLLHYSALADGFPLKSRMLCVARTFLFCLAASATDRPAAFLCAKIWIIFGVCK